MRFHNARFGHASNPATFRVADMRAAVELAAHTGRTVIFQPSYKPNHYDGPGAAVAIHPDGTMTNVTIPHPWDK